MNLNSILRNCLLVGIFLIPLVPLIVVTSPLFPSLFFPYITGKNFAFRILTELMVGGWLILMLRDATYRPRRSLLLIAITVFTFTVALADAFSVNPLKSFWSNFERMEGFVTIAHLLLYFLVAGAIITTEKLWHRFWLVSFTAAVIAGLYALMQVFGWFPMHQGDRPDSTLGNATYLAGYLLFHSFLAAFFFIRNRGNKLWQWTYGILGAFFALIVYFTASRGALLGLVGGVLLTALLIVFFERGNRRIQKFAIGAIIGIVALVGLFFAVRHTSFVQHNHVLERLASISLDAGKSRFLVWNMAWQSFQDKPVLGWGQESFNFVFNKYFDPLMYDQESWFDRVHNVFLDWLIATGGLGLLTYLALYVTALLAIWRRNFSLATAERAILTGLLAAYAIHNFFVFDNIVSYILFFSLLAYLHYQTASPTPLLSGLKLNQNITDRFAMPFIVIATLFALYFLNVTGLLVAHDLTQALSAHSPAEGGLSVNLAQFKQALQRNSFGQQEVREQLTTAATQIASVNVDTAIKQEFLTLAHDEMQKQIDKVPTDARFDLFMASLLDTYQQYSAAMPYLAKAYELSPKKQVTLFEIGSNLLNQSETEKALVVFKQAFDLAPQNNDARVIYAAGAIYVGDSQLLNTLLTEGDGPMLTSDPRLIQAYIRVGQFSQARTLLEKKISVNPQDWQSHLSLAGVYLQLGERQKAITEIQQVITLNTEFKAQGEYLIQEIQAGRNP